MRKHLQGKHSWHDDEVNSNVHYWGKHWFLVSDHYTNIRFVHCSLFFWIVYIKVINMRVLHPLKLTNWKVFVHVIQTTGRMENMGKHNRSENGHSARDALQYCYFDEIWGSRGNYYHVVVEVLDFGAVCICRSMLTFGRNTLSPSSGAEVTRHRPANTHSAKTQDLYNIMILLLWPW
jgi:hypothetical protein